MPVGQLRPVVLKALDKAPERRYQSALDVKQALARAQSESAAGAESPANQDDDFTGMMLLFAIPAVVAPTMALSGSWLPALALYLPGAAIGSCMATRDDVRQNAALAGLSFGLCLAILGLGVYVTGDPKVLIGLVALCGGVMSGGKEQEKRERERDAT